MPDPSPEQPPSWPPTSEPAATPTNPPRITARGVGHLPSAAPEDETASDSHPRPPAGLYGESAQPADFAELDPEARRNEWAADLGGPAEAPHRPEPPAYGAPQHPQAAPGGDWGDSAGWPPKSSQDWVNQQSHTGWGLTAGGGAAWPSPAGQDAPEAPGEPPYQPEAMQQTPGLVPPQAEPHRAGFEFPELRADPYEADVYNQTQYRGDAGGQDLYQSDPYQAERLAAEAQAARERYVAEQQQQQPAPFPPAQQAAYAEPQAAPGEAYQPPIGSPGESSTPPAPGGEWAPAENASYVDRHSAAEAPPAPGAVPEQRRSEETAAPEAADEKQVRVAPPTHRGVRYTIYGIGGLITIGLIIAIVLMLGATPSNDSTDPEGDGSSGSETSGADESLSSERYAELAAAAGTDEWYSWRYGEAGSGSGAEEVAAASGDALASEPLLGDADRGVQGQLGYVTEDSSLSGVDHVTVVETTDDSIGLTPRAGGRFSEDGTPELELVEGSTADCVAALGVDLGEPVAIARPEQSEEMNAHSVVAFSSGVIATTGVSGAQGGTCLQLPEGQVPTDVALTDGNELALVTTWNAQTQTGSLVVIALGDKSGTYQSSWSESYPGLPNSGHFATAQIVGTVELPFSAPTSVDAWSDSSGSSSLKRDTVEGGAHADTVATSAYAVVGDLSSSQVAVVDLTSTLQGLAAQYYESAEFAFDATSGEAIDFDGGVADVAAAEAGPAVATSDGVVHELGRDLAETAATEVGDNPTCLVVGAQSGQFIATSRGTGTISWVSGGEVSKQLADSRMTDPLCASETPALDTGEYTGSASVVLVSDYEGQQLHAYLDGTATLAGGATVGGDGFTYGGSYAVDGKPWYASVTVDIP